MKEIHILFTAIGRRVELVQAFRSAALTLNKSLKIYGADLLATAPALAYCDYTRLVCRMTDSRYIPQLLEICRTDRIDLVIPTIDTDLQLLADNKEAFEAIGTRVLISGPDKIRICRDKNVTSAFFVECGLKAPLPTNDYRNYRGGYPAFIKPKDGSSSINAFKVTDGEELAFYAGQIQDYIIQPFVSGKEYTIDIFCDFEGNPVSIVPRERLAVRAGEVLKTRICMDEVLLKEAEAIIRNFKPCGPMTVQLIRDGISGEDYFIEINPRYGGGAPLSMKAGAKSAQIILRLLSGEELPAGQPIQDGAEYSRFDQSVCTNAGESAASVQGVIFDLDDTLYPEKQYVCSGYTAVAAWLGELSYADKLWDYFLAGKPAITALLEETGHTDKEAECLKIYREHMPAISLYEGMADLLGKLKAANIKTGIITDGRPEGQKHKIIALGLENLVDDIIITDELGGVQFRKPNDIAFRIMQTRWRVPYENLIYVGDNPVKDFQAPTQLGMQTLFFRNSDGLYSTKAQGPVFCGDTADTTEQLQNCLLSKI